MKENYELTIVMSNYNQEKYISRAIDSVFSQIVDFPFQLIITDDHSCQDRSIEIIRDYADKHDNIELILSDKRGGYLANILRAKAIAKTDYLCLLDADDYWTDPHFLQRAYDFLSTHKEYVIYEANVEVIPEEQSHRGKRFRKSPGRRPFISPKIKSGTYTKEMFLRNASVPITQTTGMFLRNCIFKDGIPEIMTNAVGTRSERSFEGDTGRFIMHLKHGPAYYDDHIVGVYRLTQNGIWASMSASAKLLASARIYIDYYKYYGSHAGFFVNRSYQLFQSYLDAKQKEIGSLNWQDTFMDENEILTAEDIYRFCRQYGKEIVGEKRGLKGFKKKLRQILRVLKS